MNETTKEVFPLQHTPLASLRGEVNLTEMTFELAYCEIRESPLWETLDNSEWDAKATELAAHVRRAVDDWLAAQYAAFLEDYSRNLAPIGERL